ncbi:transposase [Patescibacteria group bacterium]|nr:transposase [Patescibacteria group bacterium]
MGRALRVDVKDQIYHVLNRANACLQIFDNDKDYQMFEEILEEAKEKFDMRVLAYSVMPNHWHLVLCPKKDDDLKLFMSWLSNTHTKRWHAVKKTIGQGHLYQGRYKSFICQDDSHFLTLVRYVERNPKKANLVKKAENWKWGSVWRRESGTEKQRKLLSEWIISEPKSYLKYLNEPQNESEEKAIQNSILRGNPYGGDSWKAKIIKKFKLETTIRPQGRPKKGG